MTESTFIGDDRSEDVRKTVRFEFCDEDEGSIRIDVLREEPNSLAKVSASFDLEDFRATVCTMLMMMYRCGVDPILPVEVERVVRGECPICGSELCSDTHMRKR